MLYIIAKITKATIPPSSKNFDYVTPLLKNFDECLGAIVQNVWNLLQNTPKIKMDWWMNR